MDRTYNWKDGEAGLGYFIENEIDWYTRYDEDVKTFIDNLSKREYDQLLHKIINKLERNEDLLNIINDIVELDIDNTMKQWGKEGYKTW